MSDLFQSEKLANKRVEIEILPNLGANLSSFKVDGQQLIYVKKELEADNILPNGCFMMFPTPCRLTGAKYNFQGKVIRQNKNGNPVAIHGLVRNEPFTIAKNIDTLTASIKIDKNHPVFQGYPFNCVFSLEFHLLERGLQITFTFENTDDCDAPFGFGLHPFWLIPGQRKDVLIQVPCDKALELVNLIPTGNANPVAGTDLDLRKFRSLEGINIDNAFWGRNKSSEQGLIFKDLGKKLTLESDDVFEHMIAYAPAGQSFVCLENLTCTPDAPNLYDKGKKEISGLKVVAPGKKLTGRVKYIISDL